MLSETFRVALVKSRLKKNLGLIPDNFRVAATDIFQEYWFQAEN